MPYCKECGQYFRRITRTHLAKHNMTTKDYQEKYPAAELIDSDLKYEYGKKAREDHPMKYQENKDKISRALTGKPMTEKTKQKLREARLGVSWGNHTEEFKQKMSEKAYYIMKNNWLSGKMSNAHSDEANQKRSKTMQGNTNWLNSPHNKGVKLNLTDEQKKNRSYKACLRYVNFETNKMNTSLEKKFIEWLMKKEIAYQQQYMLEDKKGCWVYDFFLPDFNALIEVDGIFWHTKKQQFNRDKIKSNIAVNQGFEFLRIDEDHWNPEKLFDDDCTNWSLALLDSRITY